MQASHVADLPRRLIRKTPGRPLVIARDWRVMRRLTILLVITVLVTTGCKSNEKKAETVANNSPPVALSSKVNNHGTRNATTREIEVEADDFYFSPTFIKGTPGASLTVKLHNEGKATHTFTSQALGVDQEVKPGERADISLTVPSTSAAEFHCRFHADQGMRRVLFSRAGQSVSGGTSGGGGTGGGGGY